MRIRIVFKLENKGSFLPFHHQHILAQFLKGALVKGGRTDYIDYPDYNFSGLKGQTKISRNGLHYYSNLVTLVLSSADQMFLDYLLDQIFSFEQIDLSNLKISPLYTEIEKNPPMEEVSKFLCISPMVPIQSNGFDDQNGKRFVFPDTDEFSDLLYDSTFRRMEATGLYTDEQMASFNKFQIVPDSDYLTRIQERGKKFARIYSVFENDVKYEVRGYTLPFKLYAAKEVQEFIFNSGLGDYTFKGFGMLDIANADPTERTEKYHFSREAVAV
ncbi:CRISPR-associated endoribonuclease Cas6 [Roseivirga sp.]|uniref:CRISPR-associated endoribonuclease Cas6 n=1 Tax=Roseivirga sp. TaxID=1964215 RepID=UPI003B8D978C